MNPSDLVHTIAFYFLGVVSVAGALVAVTSMRILRSAVGLAITLACAAGFYIMLNVDFIAGVQVLVYVGGIVVLIVFAIMLTSSLEWVEDHPTTMRRGLALTTSILFFAITMAALSMTQFNVDISASQPENIAAALGLMLLDTGSGGYVLPFELISLLLLAAVLGSVVVARSYGEKTSDEKSEGEMS